MFEGSTVRKGSLNGVDYAVEGMSNADLVILTLETKQSAYLDPDVVAEIQATGKLNSKVQVSVKLELSADQATQYAKMVQDMAKISRIEAKAEKA